MEAAELKKNSRVQKVVVTGCLAQRYSTELAGENRHGCKEAIGVCLNDNPPSTCIGLHLQRYAFRQRLLALVPALLPVVPGLWLYSLRLECNNGSENNTCAVSLPEADYIVGFQNYGGLPATLRNALQPATGRGGDAEARVQVGAHTGTRSSCHANHTFGQCGVFGHLLCMRL